MSTPTPQPIFDAAELRAKALAAHASWMGNGRKWYPLSSLTDVLDAEDSVFIEAASPTVTIALLDERATLLARVEAAEAERDQLRRKIAIRATAGVDANGRTFSSWFGQCSHGGSLLTSCTECDALVAHTMSRGAGT